MSDEELTRHLQEELSLSANKQVFVRADRDVPLKRVVTVMDIAKKYGAQNLMLATEMKAPKK